MLLAMAFSNGLLRGQLRDAEPMARHCSWRAGGPAARYYVPADETDLAVFLRGLPADEPLLWVGLGSNLLVRDGGFAGTVINTKGVFTALRFHGQSQMYGGAGVPCAKVARQSVQRRLSGAEFLAGIPGSLGGALAMNAGAFGGETWDLVHSARVIDRNGTISDRKAADFHIGYRRVSGPGELWFLGAELRLRPDSDGAGVQRVRDLLAQRGASQPTGVASCGSVFRNPRDGHAGALIERAGLKGRRIGQAQISPKHANFIVNLGGARASDIEALVELARERVAATTGVELEPEVRIVGDAEARPGRHG